MRARPKKIVEGNKYLKDYWGEGTNRAQIWERYDTVKQNSLVLRSVDGYVPYAGKLKDNPRNHAGQDPCHHEYLYQGVSRTFRKMPD
jgi:hypothetical protein